MDFQLPCAIINIIKKVYRLKSLYTCEHSSKGVRVIWTEIEQIE